LKGSSFHGSSPLIVEEYIMKSWILGALLAGGMAFAQTTPANAQFPLSFGRSGTSPGVTLGQPAYGNGYYGQPAYNNGYYGQAAPTSGYYGPGLQNNAYGQPAYNSGYYGQAAQASGYYGQAAQNNGYGQPAYNNGYYGQGVQNNGYYGQPAYGANRYSSRTYVQTYPPTNTYTSGYQGYAPSPGYSPNNAYPGYGYGNQGMNVNVPSLGRMNMR
jgi:hypothetical protein